MKTLKLMVIGLGLGIMGGCAFFELGEEHPAYYVIDLSGGSTATTYPVASLKKMPEGGWTLADKTDKLVLAYVDKGSFRMGCESSEVGFTNTEAIPHDVEISKGFYMGVFPVTQRQYELVMGNNPSRFKGEVRPVEHVSYDDVRGRTKGANWPASTEVDADSFFGLLRAKTRLEGFDLPTEAQWEYACRAGTATALNSGVNLSDKRRCPEMDEVGRYRFNSGFVGGSPDGKGGDYRNHTTVGSYRPNGWGLYDMHGNIYEWCLDWFQPRSAFTNERMVDPVGPIRGNSRLLRGGSLFTDAADCRSAHRGTADQSGRNEFFGFRVCCNLR